MYPSSLAASFSVNAVTGSVSTRWGLAAVEGRVSVPDWHATILHLLGLRHDELFVERNGFKERRTRVSPTRVVTEIQA